MQEQQETEIALLRTKNAFLAHSAVNATQTMKQQKATFTEQMCALSDNRMVEIAAHTKQMCVLSVQNGNQTAEMEHLHVIFDSHKKLQNKTKECELAASRSEAHTNLTMNSKPKKLLSTSRWTSIV